MSIINSQPLIGASGQGGGYNLTKSLRFRSSASAYLNRTPASAGNRRTYTWSGWVKRGILSSGERTLFNAGGTLSDTGFLGIRFTSDDKLDVTTGSTDLRQTTQVFRDPSAWYHIVVAMDTTQATGSNRVKVYLNGTQITAFSTSNDPSLNLDTAINNTVGHAIGLTSWNSAGLFDGYMTEINFIDGQALTPSSFGQTSPTTGVWQPIKYTGTYGTNGFYLPFTDVATTSGSNAGLGKDFSGNGNYWTTNNISVTTGTTYDSMSDVPTLTSATAANYCVLNPLGGSTNTIQNGNLQLTGTAAGNTSIVGSLAVSSGKWYFETTITTLPSGQDPLVGVSNVNSSNLFTTYPGEASTSYSVYLYQSNSFIQKVNNNTFTNTSATTIAQGDVIGVALDLDNGKIWFSKNGTFVDSGSPTGGTNAQFTGLSGSFVPALRGTGGASTTTLSPNFGQQPFAYTPPTGFVALNTFNLPTPTIGATASTQAGKYFGINLWTGNGSTGSRAITGLGFKPDWVWWKNRTTAKWHQVFDSNRGADKALSTNATDAEDASGGYGGEGSVTSFDTDGYTLQGGVGNNENGSAIVGWAWQAGQGTNVSNTAGSITSTVSANTTAGFSIATLTTQSSGTGTFGHGLGVAPSLVICKYTSTTSNWFTWHTGIAGTSYLLLNTTAASTSNSAIFSAAPTSTVVNLGTAWAGSGQIVAYCFAQVAGYSAFGSYTGNGSSDGTFVYTGFRPRYVLRKRTDSSARWFVIDSSRDTFNVGNDALYPNFANAEEISTTNWGVDFLSNGFKVRSTDIDSNANGGTFIYMAFAEFPQKFSLAR